MRWHRHEEERGQHRYRVLDISLRTSRRWRSADPWVGAGAFPSGPTDRPGRSSDRPAFHPGTRSRPGSSPLCPQRGLPPPPVRESFFKILNDLRVLFLVPPPSADVSKAGLLEYTANRYFVEIDVEAFLDDVSEIDTSPTHDTILDWVGRGFHNPLQLLFLFRRQFRARAGSFAVDQPCWTVRIEPMNPIAPRLSIHRYNVCRLLPPFAVDHGRQRKYTP